VKSDEPGRMVGYETSMDDRNSTGGELNYAATAKLAL
jgi:hypothetical protein